MTRFTDTDDWRATRSLMNSAGFLAPHLRRGMSVIDCGCGPGSITCDLAEAVAPGEVIGVDNSSGILERAEATARERAIKNVRFELGDINKLRFPSDSFDAALESSTLQYLPRPMRAVREIYRVLKPGGVFGARDRDYHGDFFGNVNATVRAAWRMHYASYKRVNGLDLTLGGRLRPMLLRAGFENLVNSATYEDHGDQEGARKEPAGSRLSTRATSTMPGTWDGSSSRGSLRRLCSRPGERPGTPGVTTRNPGTRSRAAK
jgi:SAM-dependent methyltransferase